MTGVESIAPHTAKDNRERSYPTIWFEVESLLRHFDWHGHPSGIERVCIELFMAAQKNDPRRIGFCRLSAFTHRFQCLDFAALRATWSDGEDEFARSSSRRRAKLF